MNENAPTYGQVIDVQHLLWIHAHGVPPTAVERTVNGEDAAGADSAEEVVGPGAGGIATAAGQGGATAVTAPAHCGTAAHHRFAHVSQRALLGFVHLVGPERAVRMNPDVLTTVE